MLILNLSFGIFVGHCLQWLINNYAYLPFGWGTPNKRCVSCLKKSLFTFFGTPYSFRKVKVPLKVKGSPLKNGPRGPQGDPLSHYWALLQSLCTRFHMALSNIQCLRRKKWVQGELLGILGLFGRALERWWAWTHYPSIHIHICTARQLSGKVGQIKFWTRCTNVITIPLFNVFATFNI